MKKLVIATALLAAGIASADIVSSSIVGYQTVDALKQDQFVALAVQFENIAGGEIAVTNLVTVASPSGSSKLDYTADQIWRWDTAEATWIKYYYRKVRGVAYGWCKSGAEVATDDTIPAGETFFFRRASGAVDTGLTLAGGVKEFTGSAEYSATGDQLVFMANPWPVETVIKDFANYQTSPSGSSKLDYTADQIWRWDTSAATWAKYYYRKVRGVAHGWCEAGKESATTDTIPAGEGFFFRRASGAKEDTITFTAPSAE